MDNWVFCEYICARDRSDHQEWYVNLTSAAQAHFDSRLMYIQALTKIQRPHWAPLTRDGKGLVEVRFQTENIQHRAIACMGHYVVDDGSLSDHVIFLGGLIEKGEKFPKGALDKMQRRKKDLIKTKNYKPLQN